MRSNRVLAALTISTIGALGSQVFVTPVRASPPAEVEGPVEGPLPSVEDEPATDSGELPDVAPDPVEPEPAPEPMAEPEKEPTPEPPPPTLQQPTVVRVAVGLSSELDGNKAEKALLNRLESGVRASTSPRADVRRLRVGSAEAREICREGLDDLVISVGYLPDRNDPVLLTRDCRIDEDLGIRSTDAADDPALLGVLWAEHNDRISNGARERKRLRVSPGVRTGLIAGAAVAVIGVAVGFLIAGAVRRDSVVLVVQPK
jgi:hypothetical protein